jgi:hypothetical protein
MSVPAYVDAARLCQELCICERTAEAWARQGILPAPRMRGGKRLWKWKEVEAYLDDGGPAAPPSADAEAERVRNATKRLAEEAAENRRRNVRRSDPGLSVLPGLRKSSA